ncbi:MAG: ABC transporter permease [Gemmatimonadaceae bacterium]
MTGALATTPLVPHGHTLLLRRVMSSTRSRWALFVLAVLLAAIIIGPAIRDVDPTTLDFANTAAKPSLAHPLGTDESGRDTLARLLSGGRVSLSVGLAAVFCSLFAGISLGALAGYRRGPVDTVVMRFTDAMLSIPTLFLVITALTFLGATTPGLIVAIGATSWMGIARLVRGEMLSLREQPFVEASRALGAPGRRIVWRHVLPHIGPSIVINATLGIGTAILTESALSFLGLGVQPPAASWGNMLSGAQNYLTSAPRLALYPGAFIVVTVVAINVLGDVLRDALDPAGSSVA